MRDLQGRKILSERDLIKPCIRISARRQAATLDHTRGSGSSLPRG
jgi:hypothetical protein